MTERRPGPFDDLFGGRQPERGQPPSPPGPESRPPEPEALPPESPREEPPPQEPPEELPPRREPPAAPASDPFATAPLSRPVQPAAAEPPSRTSPATRAQPPVRRPAKSGRDPIPYLIGGVVFILALLVFALFLPPLELLNDDDESSPEVIATVCDGVTQEIADDIPTVPPGLTAESPLRLLSAETEPCGPLNIGLNLNSQTDDGTGLGFYTFAESSYRKLADATLTEDGTVAEGQLEVLPENVIVLRRTASTVRVEGFLPSGLSPDPAAQGVIGVVAVESYTPGQAGSIAGSPPTLTVEGAEVIPVVRADNQAEVDAVDALLQSDVDTDAHIEALRVQVVDNNLAGIELDYGCLSTSLSSDLTNLVLGINTAIGEDRRLSIVVPGPDSCPNFGAYNLQELGEIVDFIKLMPVRDQTTYRQDMAQILSTAVAVVPRQKLLLVIPTLSTFRGPDGVIQLVSEQEALARAAVPTLNSGDQPAAPGDELTFIGRRVDPASGASALSWSDSDLAVKFSYEDEGTFTYWIENSFSIAFKLDLAARFQIAGVAVENASDDPVLADAWTPIGTFVENSAPTLVKPNPASFALEWRVDGQVQEGESSPTFVWAAVAVAATGCVAPVEPGQHCVTLVVADGDIRVGGEVLVTVEEAGAEGEEGVEGETSPTPTATPTATP
jgi:hypothetical protein